MSGEFISEAVQAEMKRNSSMIRKLVGLIVFALCFWAAHVVADDLGKCKAWAKAIVARLMQWLLSAVAIQMLQAAGLINCIKKAEALQ